MNEIFSIIFNLLSKLHDDSTTFSITVTIAILLSVGCWVICSYFSRLWNKRYKITSTHHVLCFFAALFTFIFSLTFVSLKYTEEVATLIVFNWETEVKNDQKWKKNTFIKAYEAVKSLNLEDFSKTLHPNDGGNTIPATKDESRIKFASVYANEAVKHFDKSHAFLSKIIWAKAEIPSKFISKDVKDFFSNPLNLFQSYPVEKAINLAAQHIRQELDRQTPNVVSSLKIMLIILFFIIQSIPFGLIGYAAYKDIKIIT